MYETEPSYNRDNGDMLSVLFGVAVVFFSRAPQNSPPRALFLVGIGMALAIKQTCLKTHL